MKTRDFSVWLTHLNLDFGAHTLCVSSTHEYYSHTKYELQSPTLSGSTIHNFPTFWATFGQFLIKKTSEWPNVNSLRIRDETVQISNQDISANIEYFSFGIFLKL